MITAKKEVRRDLVAEAAKRALEDANGDVREATAMLEAAVRQSRELRDTLTDPLIGNACYDAVRAQCHRERRQVWKPPVEKLAPKQGGATGTVRVVQLAAGNLLMFPLPGGKRLGEATRADITVAADFYASQSADMSTKARWLRLIAQSVPEEKQVGQVLSDRRLRELQMEVQRDAQ